MTSNDSTRGKAATLALWTVTVVEALMMALAGSSKFTGAAGWSAMFVGWGYPAWFSPVTGGAEFVFALLLLIPRFATWAALVLITIMLGALATVVIHDDPLGIWAPVANLVLLSVIASGRRADRWRPGPAPTSD